MSISYSSATIALRYYAGLLILNMVQSYNIECPSEEISGPWVTPESSCRSYYTCSHGQPVIHYCPINTFFNTKSKVCGGSGSCYEIVCAGREDGKYLDSTESCERSYWCKGGRVVKIGSTTSQTKEKSACPDVSQVAARLVTKQNRCKNKYSGRYSLDDKCSGFFQCLNGVETNIQTCPTGTSFNGLKCTTGSSNHCSNICTLREDGLYADTSTDCVQYVKCSKQQIENRSICPADTAFNGYTCVPKGTFFCPGKDPCNSLEDGFYLESCQHYFKCERGKTLFKASCSSGEHFNGAYCRAYEGTSNCKSSYFSKTCLGKDGFYTNHTSHCSSYYYCRRDGIKNDLTCPVNFVFNGKVCVPVSSYSCPSVQQSCENKKDGYYLQLGSLCQSYYFCYSGNQITYYCHQGKIFNGDKCVLKSSHKCSDELACNDLSGPCS